jgi:hypothetical protein
MLDNGYQLSELWSRAKLVNMLLGDHVEEVL